MRTIGKHWRGGKREGAGLCAICGFRYPMSNLKKNADGIYVCFGPGSVNDAEGLTVSELAALEASAAETFDDVDYAGEVAPFDLGER